jgi:retron-type reverse transcriptase
MANTFDYVTSYKSLNSAWRELYAKSRPKSKNTSGIDGQSLNDFAANAVANLHALSRKLRSKRYHFSKLKACFLTKPKGGERVICIGTTEDRIVQGALLHFLSERYTTRFSNDVSYGFLKNRGVQEAAEIAVKKRNLQPWVFKTDIKSFFDNISRTELKLKLKKVIRETTLHPLIFQIVDSEIHTPTRKERAKVARQGIKNGLGVRQGMSLSPFFSNVVLEAFDKAIVKAGFSALRYADDLIFFSSDLAGCHAQEEFARIELKKEKLEIPPSGIKDSKSEIFGPSDIADFLGIGLCQRSSGTYVIKILPKQLEKIRESFMDLSTVSQLLSRGITLAILGQHLTSKKSGYSHAYSHSENLAELETDLEDIVRKVLKKLYQTDLKIPTQELSPDAYAFLGLG